MLSFRPTWAEIDLSALQSNLRRFKTKLPKSTKILFVVKGNAYGHGAAPVSLAAEASGLVSWFGVSSIEEGILLRKSGIKLPILILGSLYPFDGFDAVAEYNLTPTIASYEGARRLAMVAQKFGAGAPIACHLKLDTGMGRIGMGWPSGLAVARYVSEQKAVKLEGVYTHLAGADSNRSFTSLQIERFKGALTDLREAKIDVPLRHAANSVAALEFPESRFDMVRPGLSIYGLYGSGFQPMMSLKSRIVFLKSVKAGTPIGYGGTYKARRQSKIATLPVGYADGYFRLLSNRAEVLVHGRRCPVVGAVSMDMTTVDVSQIPQVRVGDEVALLGNFGKEDVRASELAGFAETIPYEIVTQISSRVPRIYVNSPAALRRLERVPA